MNNNGEVGGAILVVDPNQTDKEQKEYLDMIKNNNQYIGNKGTNNSDNIFAYPYRLQIIQTKEYRYKEIENGVEIEFESSEKTRSLEFNLLD